MTDASKKRLGEMLQRWVATLTRDEVVRRYRGLSWDEKMAATGYGWQESASALNSAEPYNNHLEILARCFEVFADAEEPDPVLSSEKRFRERAHALRNPDEWRVEQRTAAERNRMSDRRLHALALASSCLAEGPTDVRLRRIEEVLPQLNELADQAAAEGNLREQSAIGTDIGDLWKLRDALRRTS
ncbi:MAG: hypothetical protein J2P43_08630, partial [Candidatus Dormibacteraeota bacterium]|nr:hypothetical protein [Candidatus Dormibacteraeota bacterium]